MRGVTRAGHARSLGNTALLRAKEEANSRRISQVRQIAAYGPRGRIRRQLCTIWEFARNFSDLENVDTGKNL